MVGCARCLAGEQNRHRETATSPGICTVPANGGVPVTTAKELGMWTLFSCLFSSLAVVEVFFCSSLPLPRVFPRQFYTSTPRW